MPEDRFLQGMVHSMFCFDGAFNLDVLIFSIQCISIFRFTSHESLCTLTCPGLEGISPLLRCNVCMCLFHPQCVNFKGDLDKGFLCLVGSPFTLSTQTDRVLENSVAPNQMQQISPIRVCIISQSITNILDISQTVKCSYSSSILATLWTTSAEDKLIIFVLFFSENRLWHFMQRQFACCVKTFFLGHIKKYFKMYSEIITQLRVKIIW